MRKRRDRYVCSAYVFVPGLAIYETNTEYREAYRKFYGFREKEDRQSAHPAAGSVSDGKASAEHRMRRTVCLAANAAASGRHDAEKERKWKDEQRRNLILCEMRKQTGSG